MASNSILITVKKILNYTLFEINQTPVSLFSILMFILVILMFFLVSRIVNRILLKRMLIKIKVRESTRYMLLRINHYIIVIIGAIVAFQFIGVNLSGLAVIFGLSCARLASAVGLPGMSVGRQSGEIADLSGA